MTPDRVTIAIGGDTVPTRNNEDCLSRGEADTVFGRVKKIFRSADLAVVNLECPLTNHSAPIKKAGPCLKAKPDTIRGLLDAGINTFSLANNHIMDFGTEGLVETIRLITGNGATFAGAGRTLQDARRILNSEIRGCRIALICAAEHEFSIAEEEAPGANPFDPFDTLDDIRTAGSTADLVIVLYHGGIEHYPLPSPNLQRACRKMVENGANYVICQHSHCIGSYERYHDGYIVYGQGNLLFDYSDHELWQTGLVIRIILEGGEKGMEFLPIVRKASTIDLADGGEKERILASFHERSRHLGDPHYVANEWLKFAGTRKYRYLQTLLGFGKLVKRLDNRLGHLVTDRLFNRNAGTLLYNFLECESHLELARSILREIVQPGDADHRSF